MKGTGSILALHNVMSKASGPDVGHPGVSRAGWSTHTWHHSEPHVGESGDRDWAVLGSGCPRPRLHSVSSTERPWYRGPEEPGAAPVPTPPPGLQGRAGEQESTPGAPPRTKVLMVRW